MHDSGWVWALIGQMLVARAASSAFGLLAAVISGIRKERNATPRYVAIYIGERSRAPEDRRSGVLARSFTFTQTEDSFLAVSTVISTTARATDEAHLELRHPLGSVPDADVRVLIFVESAGAKCGPADVSDFLAWASRPRPSVGLRGTGRDAIYED